MHAVLLALSPAAGATICFNSIWLQIHCTWQTLLLAFQVHSKRPSQSLCLCTIVSHRDLKVKFAPTQTMPCLTSPLEEPRSSGGGCGLGCWCSLVYRSRLSLLLSLSLQACITVLLHAMPCNLPGFARATQAPQVGTCNLLCLALQTLFEDFQLSLRGCNKKVFSLRIEPSTRADRTVCMCTRKL